MREKKHSALKIILLSLCVCALMAGAASAAMSDEDFLQLCSEGTLKQVNDAIKNGADVNAKDKYGETALMYAARTQPDPDVITALIESGADVSARIENSARIEYGWTPLVFAASDNLNPEVITALVKHGADVNVDTENGATPLFIVAGQENASLEMVTALIKNGADVNCGDTVNGGTPLHQAVGVNRNPEDRLKENRLKIVMALIKAGADVNSEEFFAGVTPIMRADFSDLKLIKLLVESGADLRALEDRGMADVKEINSSKASNEVINYLKSKGMKLE